jgi:hypothetical protein
MRSFLLLLVCLAGASAQEVVPTYERAIARLATTIARELPWLAPEAASASVAAADRGSLPAARDLADRLRRDGFRLVESGEADVVLTLAATKDGGARRLTVRTSGRAATEFGIGYGGAEWVDRPENRARVVVGAPGDSPEAARRNAELQLSAQRRAAYPALAARRGGEAHFSRAPSALFVAEEFDGVAARYVAYVLGPDDGARLASYEAEAASAARRAPWVKGVVAAVLLAGAFLLFKVCDWITRGWRTRALGVVFGSLSAVALLGLWRLPV